MIALAVVAWFIVGLVIARLTRRALTPWGAALLAALWPAAITVGPAFGVILAPFLLVARWGYRAEKAKRLQRQWEPQGAASGRVAASRGESWE